MDLISEITTPILQRYDGETPTFEVFLASYNTSARLHLGDRCKNATITDRRGAELIARHALCSRCGKPGAHINADDAQRISDAFALQAAARTRSMLRTSTSSTYSLTRDTARIVAMLDQAATFGGAPHPAAALLISLIPGAALAGAADLVSVAALATTSWEASVGELEAVRVLAGTTSPAAKLWPTVIRTVLAGQSIELAIVSAIAGIEQGSGATIRTLPNTLALDAATFASTSDWMHAEWDGATRTARATLASSMHASLTAACHDTTGDRWVIVATNRTEVSRARERARRRGWMLAVGNSSRWNGLICAPVRVLDALTFLSSDQASFKLALTANDTIAVAAIVEAVRRSPEILRIAEQLKMDDEDLTWDQALERAALVPSFT